MAGASDPPVPYVLPRFMQGYRKSSQALLKARQLPQSLKMADLALERVEPADHQRREKLMILDAQGITKKGESRNTYHFGKLPIEIATRILSLSSTVIHLGQLRYQTFARTGAQWH